MKRRVEEKIREEDHPVEYQYGCIACRGYWMSARGFDFFFRSLSLSFSPFNRESPGRSNSIFGSPSARMNGARLIFAASWLFQSSSSSDSTSTSVLAERADCGMTRGGDIESFIRVPVMMMMN